MSRTNEIATTDGRSSRQKTPRRSTDLDSKERGDNSLLLKRKVVEDVYATVLQRLSARAKAGLPEPCATSPIARSSSQRKEVRKKDLRVTQLTR